MKCKAIVTARWHTPAHPCSFTAVHDGLCAKHLTRPQQIRFKIAKLENEKRELDAMLRRQLDSVRADIRKLRAELR